MLEKATLSAGLPLALSLRTPFLLRWIAAFGSYGDTEAAKSYRNGFDLGRPSFTFASADLLATTIRKRLADYKTSVSDDDNVLRRLMNESGAQVPSGVHPNRYRMAVSVRKGRRRSYNRYCSWLSKFIMSHANGKRKHGTDDEQPKKAHKAKK